MTFYQVPFQSSMMSRNLLMGVFQSITGVNEVRNCTINCVHLESMNNEKLRTIQLKDITQLNKDIDIVLLAGDMNFSDNWAEDKIIQSEYIDLWNEFQDKKTERWTMPLNVSFPQWRPDHILIKSNKIVNE